MAASMLDDVGMAYSVHNAILAICQGNERQYDLMLVEEENKEPVYSHLVVMMGLGADVGLESERCRCIGRARINLFAVMRICSNRCYNIRLSFLGKKIARQTDFN